MAQRAATWRSARSNGAAHEAMLAQRTAIVQRAAMAQHIGAAHCGPDARDPLGGSSQFKYYPYLLALSNPKKSLGRGRSPPCAPPPGHRCAARTKSQSGDFVVAGGGVSEIEASGTSSSW
jgi:hypothetical protein